MKILGWVIFAVIGVAGDWFFCRGVGNKSRNRPDQHGGGIERSSDGVDMID
jgi:hypothetical protein